MARNTKTDEDIIPADKNPYLEGGEARLVRALMDDELCFFDDETEPEDDRAIRGSVLSAIFRQERIEGTDTPLALPRKIQIYGANIKGDLDASDTDIDRVVVFYHCKFDSPINLDRAQLKLLGMTDCTLSGLSLRHARIDSNCVIDHTKMTGSFSLVGAEIGGQFSANQATFNGPSSKAIWAQGAKIAGGVFLNGTEVQGETDFNGADIGYQFSAENAKFIHPSGTAIWAQSAKIAGDVFLDKAEMRGEAAFNSADISGQFSAEQAKFINPGGNALFAQNLQLTDLFWLGDLKHPPLGDVVLTNGKFADIIIDDTSFPLGSLKLDGTVYSDLARPGGVPHKKNRGWLEPPEHDIDGQVPGFSEAYQAIYAGLERESPDDTHQEIAEKTWSLLQDQITDQSQQGRSPFAYRQFSKTLDANGHEAEARDIRVLAGRAYTERTLPNIPSFMRLPYLGWRWFLRSATGYSAKPWRVFTWLFATWFVGAAVFALWSAEMTPAKERYYMATIPAGETLPPLYVEGDPLPEGYPKFSPIIYALDVMLPFIDIAQETHWRPRAKETMSQRGLLYFNRFYLLFGWFLTTVGLAGLTGLFADKKEP